MQRGIRDLRKTQQDLFERNQRLQTEIDRLHNQADVSVQPQPAKSGGKSNALQLKVKELEVKVRRLKKVLPFNFNSDKRDCVAHSDQARALDRKKIRQVGWARLDCTVHVILFGTCSFN